MIYVAKRLKLLEKLWIRFMSSLRTRTTKSWHLHTVFGDQVESGMYMRLNKVTGSRYKVSLSKEKKKKKPSIAFAPSIFRTNWQDHNMVIERELTS